MLRTLYKHFTEDKTQGAEVYREAIVRHEQIMREQWKERMPTMLRERTESMRKVVSRETADAAKVLLPTLERFGVDVTLFSQKENKLYYNHKDESGTSAWSVSINESGMAVMRHVKNPAAVLSLELKEFLTAIENKKMPELLREANGNAASENAGQATLKAFDLPKEGKMMHLRVFPKRSSDNLAPMSLPTAAFLSSALQKRYGERMQVAPLLLTDDPLTSLRAAIAESSKDGKGARIFVIDLFEHGERDRIDFKKSLTAADLASLGTEFPQCQFHINTLACYGGGLREGFLKAFANAPELTKRMQVFLQTKPHLINYGGRIEINKQKSQWSSAYYAHLAAGLYEGKTYGEAAADADRAVKDFFPQDAEALIDGKLIGAAGSSNDVDHVSRV